MECGKEFARGRCPSGSVRHFYQQDDGALGEDPTRLHQMYRRLCHPAARAGAVYRTHRRLRAKYLTEVVTLLSNWDDRTQIILGGASSITNVFAIIQAKADSIESKASKGEATANDEFEGVQRIVWLVMIAVTALALLFTIFLGFVVGRSISRSLQTLSGTMENSRRAIWKRIFHPPMSVPKSETWYAQFKRSGTFRLSESGLSRKRCKKASCWASVAFS